MFLSLGNYDAFLLYFFGTTNVNYSIIPEQAVKYTWAFQQRREMQELTKFAMSIVKSFWYPIGLLLQILTIIFLVRGNSGYSKSARRWFLIVLGADISSTVFRLYDLISVDFQRVNPFMDNSSAMSAFGQAFLLLLWGLRRIEHNVLQDVICRIFFILIYFPIYLSPIALTISSLIRSYCVKFPLRAKAALTTKVDRCLMALAVFLSLAFSVVIAAIVVDGWSNANIVLKTFNDIEVLYGDCQMPSSQFANSDNRTLFIGYIFMLVVIFTICAFNIASAVIIIIVLFEAKKNRKSLSSSEGAADSKAEIRATAMLLGMNITLFICFFVSRVMAVLSAKMNAREHPIAVAVLERWGYYLFNIPYYTNWLFIAGFTRKFYEFYLPCLAQKEGKTTSAASHKTMEESKLV